VDGWECSQQFKTGLQHTVTITIKSLRAALSRGAIEYGYADGWLTFRTEDGGVIACKADEGALSHAA
jgi:hypothetical protein